MALDYRVCILLVQAVSVVCIQQFERNFVHHYEYSSKTDLLGKENATVVIHVSLNLSQIFDLLPDKNFFYPILQRQFIHGLQSTPYEFKCRFQPCCSGIYTFKFQHTVHGRVSI